MRDLTDIRAEIDEIDEQIKELYIRRLNIAKDVVAYKLANDKPIFDGKRETEKIEKLVGDLSDYSEREGVAGLFFKLMTDNRRKQYEIARGQKDLDYGFKIVEDLSKTDGLIIYQGEPGAYSQAATEQFFGNKRLTKNVPTWRDAMEYVKSGEADYCVLPIENSTAGSVTEIYDLLLEYDLTIIGEQVIPIEHMLLGIKGAKLSDIKNVYSHPQALMQCDGYFKRHKDLIPNKVLNTAVAAKKVATDGDKTQAAIAGEINAEIYGLDILERCIQDEDNNKTRFIILSKDKEYFKGADKISISFGLRHEKGTLFKALAYLSDNDINLSLIESRPIRKRNWEYRFFIDMEGNLSQKNVQLALAGLNDVTNDLRILGNY